MTFYELNGIPCFSLKCILSLCIDLRSGSGIVGYRGHKLGLLVRLLVLQLGILEFVVVFTTISRLIKLIRSNFD